MYKMGIEELEKVGLSFDIINAQQLFFWQNTFSRALLQVVKKFELCFVEQKMQRQN